MASKNTYRKRELGEIYNKNSGYLVIKQGYVIRDKGKNNEKSFSPSDPFNMRNEIFRELDTQLIEMDSLIDKLENDIKNLIKSHETETALKIYDDYDLQTDVSLKTDSFFENLSEQVIIFAGKSYAKFAVKITDELSKSMDENMTMSSLSLPKEEVYGKIKEWVQNLKHDMSRCIIELISEYFESGTNTEKSFFSDVGDNLKAFFEELKIKVKALAQNVVSRVQTVVKKNVFKIMRIQEYKVILNAHSNSCEKCKEMANSTHNTASLDIGETAPPFHPNCECTILPYIPGVNAEDEEKEIPENIFTAATIALEALSWIRPETPEYNECKAAICAAGMYYLKHKGCHLSAEMFRLGMYGNGKGLSDVARKMMIQRMKDSKRLNNEIFKHTILESNFDTGKIGFEFRQSTDEDLYYSVQNVVMRLKGNYIGNNKWEITVKMEDTYDFTDFRSGLKFANIANNLGEAMQRNGMMTEFETEIEYTYVWDRKELEV